MTDPIDEAQMDESGSPAVPLAPGVRHEVRHRDGRLVATVLFHPAPESAPVESDPPEPGRDRIVEHPDEAPDDIVVFVHRSEPT